MTAEVNVLLEAARELRATVNGVSADPRLVSDPEFKLAVADWLDRVANDWPIAQYGYWSECALTTARAYLGITPIPPDEEDR